MAKERNARHQSAEDFERALAGCRCAGAWTQEKAAMWRREAATESGLSSMVPLRDSKKGEQRSGDSLDVRAKNLT